jgi:hypothetical protein
MSDEMTWVAQNKEGTRITINVEGDPSDAVSQQASILGDALTIYAERNEKYKDNWRRYGWRGLLYDCRRKVERAWDALWNLRPEAVEVHADDDDLLDVVNYAALAVRAVRENNRDGEGGWWS